MNKDSQNITTTTRRSFIQRTVIGGATLAMSSHISAAEPDGKLFAYVGTFSSPLQDTLPTQVDLPPGNGMGIHIFEVDRSTGDLVSVGIERMGTSPSHLALSANGDRMYSTNETDRVGPDKHGSISAFAVDRSTGRLKLLNTVPSGGEGPTYASIHPSGKFLFVANYFGGSVAVLPIDDEGKLGPATDVKQDKGEIGPTRAKNAPPGSFAFSGHDHTHAHMIHPDPSGKFVIHVDLGLDRMFVWRFDEANGKLTPAEHNEVAMPPGDGPRHFDFHPNGKWVYSIQEEGSTIALFDYDAKSGELKERQTISSLPPNYEGSNFCSEILVSHDGKHVYGGNRLHDSIGVFSIAEDGTLTFVEDVWTRGDYPRSFEFDPSGEFLYSCNQRADNVVGFRVDRASGKLKFTGKYVAVGNPSCIVFLDTVSAK